MYYWRITDNTIGVIFECKGENEWDYLNIGGEFNKDHDNTIERFNELNVPDDIYEAFKTA